MEIFFGITTRYAMRRGSFRSVRELTDAIGAFYRRYNDGCEPFTWTKDARPSFSEVNRQRTTLRDNRSWS